jgi:hypothetical protein
VITGGLIAIGPEIGKAGGYVGATLEKPPLFTNLFGAV